MACTTAYAVVRVHGDSYRIDRTEASLPGAVAFVILIRDRLGNPIGWKLKPLLCMRGSRSRTWNSPADAIASTGLMTPGQARSAVAKATAPSSPIDGAP